MFTRRIAAYQFTINVELMMVGSPIADADWPAASVSFEMMEFFLWDVGFSSDGKHDWQRAIRIARLDETLRDEAHVGVSLLLVAHTEKDVDGEARVPDP
jgi:hypothetical protein